MKHLVGKDVTKEVDFMGDKVTVRKLSAGRIMDVQKSVEKHNKAKAADKDPMELVRIVIREGVIGGEQLSDDDFMSFPLDELNNLVSNVLGYSGLGEAETEGN